MTKHAQTIQQIYAAFGRGDIPAILEVLADDIEWEYGGSPSDVPWLQAGRGRAAAMAFFQAVGAHMDIKHFAVTDILEGPDVVVALINIEVSVKPSGGSFREIDEVHVWRFDERGRVAKFRHGVDTAAHARAWKGA